MSHSTFSEFLQTGRIPASSMWNLTLMGLILRDSALRSALALQWVLWLESGSAKGQIDLSYFRVALNLHFNLIRCTYSPQHISRELYGSENHHQKHLLKFDYGKNHVNTLVLQTTNSELGKCNGDYPLHRGFCLIVFTSI